MRMLYGERRSALVSALDGLEVIGSNAGIDLGVRLSRSDTQVAMQLAKENVEAVPLSTSAIEARVNGLVLGFAAFSPARLRRAAEVVNRLGG